MTAALRRLLRWWHCPHHGPLCRGHKCCCRDDRQELCRDVKHGRVTLACELDAGHDGWHRAVYRDRQEVTYLGAHHIVELTETVSWEPFDTAALIRRISPKADREQETP